MQEKKLRKWNWVSFIYILSKGDVTKQEQILKMNFISVMNWKAFEVENKKIKEYYENSN